MFFVVSIYNILEEVKKYFEKNIIYMKPENIFTERTKISTYQIYIYKSFNKFHFQMEIID